MQLKIAVQMIDVTHRQKESQSRQHNQNMEKGQKRREKSPMRFDIVER